MSRGNVKEISLQLAAEGKALTSGRLAALCGITRQAAHRHLAELVRQGVLVREGSGRGARYCLAGAAPGAVERALVRPFPDEDEVWRELWPKVERLAAFSENGRAIFQYAFTEMLNNALDHAEADRIAVRFFLTERGVAFEVDDDGIGIFRRVREGRGLASELEALAELSKGRVTTMPERHTGEGIFFTSKIADWFEIDAGGLCFVVDNEVDDVGVLAAPPRPGTRVRFEARPDKEKALESLFAEYTDGYEFSRTRTVIKLFALGTRLVSRSEGRRLVAGLERFREVVLDFKGVEGVGQGFVDEVFRVFARAHPEVRLVPVNMNEPVRFMVERGLRSPRPGS